VGTERKGGPVGAGTGQSLPKKHATKDSWDITGLGRKAVNEKVPPELGAFVKKGKVEKTKEGVPAQKLQPRKAWHDYPEWENEKVHFFFGFVPVRGKGVGRKRVARRKLGLKKKLSHN